METIDSFEPTKVLSSNDDDNQLCVKRLYYRDNVFRIYNYDAMTKTSYELADYQNGKYTIFNKTLFNSYFVKQLKDNPRLARSFNNFVRKDFNTSEFKEFSVKIKCFRRKINIRIIKLLRKTKTAIWD